MNIIKWILFIPSLMIMLILGFVDLVLIIVEAFLHYISDIIISLLQKIQDVYQLPKKLANSEEYCENGEN